MLTTTRPALRLRLISRLLLMCSICPALLVRCLAQGMEPDNTRAQQGGASTGATHAPVKDAQSRPITVGGFVDNAPVIFIDIAHAAGLDKFHHVSGTPEMAERLDRLRWGLMPVGQLFRQARRGTINANSHLFIKSQCDPHQAQEIKNTGLATLPQGGS